MTCQSPGFLRLLICLCALEVSVSVAPGRIGATVSGGGSPPTSHLSTVGASSSTKYLVASFPVLKQVAYVHLPDNVWRPLVIGEVSWPEAVAVDAQNSRLFVADPPNSVIWWYKLTIQPNGLLVTVGPRHAAVENYNATWLAVNSVGDLFFTGRQVTATSPPPANSIYRQDAIYLATGESLNPTEAFSRSNTGTPDPKAWAPSGLAVDSFYVYWGNEQNGTTHGSVTKGSTAAGGVLRTMHDGLAEVHGVATTGTHVFFAAPTGIYGVAKTTPTAVSDPSEGLVVAAPTDGSAWDPMSVAWDGENTLFITDPAAGILYSLPAQNNMPHNLTKFVDSPNVHGIAIIGFSSTASIGRGALSLFTGVAVLLACFSASQG